MPGEEKMTGLPLEKKDSFNNIFEELASELDITKTQYNALDQSFTAVGNWLNDDAYLKFYNVNIYPQGSFRLGTIIQPISEDDDLDIDLVCRLTNKPNHWTQKDLKDAIGNRLKMNKTYAKMIEKPDGSRRCWTLLYRANNPDEKYHIDVLPAIADNEKFFMIDEVARWEYNYENAKKTAIRITDKKKPNYATDPSLANWLKSFPDGYAAWFFSRCKLGIQQQTFSESIAPIGRYIEKKTILQKTIQILKRHRDIMFKKDKNKPISIIITTLAAKAYNGEQNLVDALLAVVNGMEYYIQKKGFIDWINNPVNQEENFADKWIESPEKKTNFYSWLNTIKEDLNSLNSLIGKENIYGFISKKFGEKISKKIMENQAVRQKKEFKNGSVKINTAGTIGATGVLVSYGHTFFGA